MDSLAKARKTKARRQRQDKSESAQLVKEIGRKIRQVRQCAGMTQQEFGKKIGSSQKAVSSWEVGKCAVPTLKMFKIVKVVKERLEFFLGEDIANID